MSPQDRAEITECFVRGLIVAAVSIPLFVALGVVAHLLVGVFDG